MGIDDKLHFQIFQVRKNPEQKTDSFAMIVSWVGEGNSDLKGGCKHKKIQ